MATPDGLSRVGMCDGSALTGSGPVSWMLQASRFPEILKPRCRLDVVGYLRDGYGHF